MMKLVDFAFTGLAAVLATSTPAEPFQLSPSFEVASVKPASPPPNMAMATLVNGGPGTEDPGRLAYTNASLRQLLRDAFAVQDHQLQGPAWLDSRRFDVIAKVPLGTSKEQAKVMLQNLLRDRFGVVLHHEQRDVPVYALVVGKGGCKMRAASDSPTSNTPEGFPKLPPGQEAAVLFSMGPAGHLRMNARKRTTGDLAVFLKSTAARPVIDETGLTGAYDFTLEFVPEALKRADGTPGLLPSAGGDHEAATPSGPDGPTIFEAIQYQLGLRLEPRKAPFDILVIDHINQTPNEN